MRDDLRNLDDALDNSGRRYLSSPKAKSQVVFSRFATQMEPAMRVFAGPELDFQLEIEAESREKTTPIAIDHTEISQIVLNRKYMVPQGFLASWLLGSHMHFSLSVQSSKNRLNLLDQLAVSR